MTSKVFVYIMRNFGTLHPVVGKIYESHDLIITDPEISSVHVKRGITPGKISYVLGQAFVSAQSYKNHRTDFLDSTNTVCMPSITNIDSYTVVLITKNIRHIKNVVKY